MLTRLKVQGFKNLRDVDLRFGFFTCIAGNNGVGKSNLFDSIQFLSHLASWPILKAATLVRGMPGRYAVLSDLFGPASESDGIARIRFEVEAVVPRVVKDDYGQDVQVRSTCMEYKLVLKLVPGDAKTGDGDKIEIEFEELLPRTLSLVKESWEFNGHEKVSKFVDGQKYTPLIETKEEEGIPRIWLRSDSFDGVTKKRLNAGAPSRIPLTTLKTVLSGVDSSAHASHLGMKREMQSWRLLQLEPSALREPDSYLEDTQITERGAHMPSALRRIGLHADVALDVSDLIRGVTSVEVDNNDVLKLRSLLVNIRGKSFPASSLSDGTLRFLALSILANDPDVKGLMCMEEPENGIHPTKIAEMINLVRRLSDDPLQLDSTENLDTSGLRQVIINTHSPIVVTEVPPNDLLFASAITSPTVAVEFLPIKNSWRARAGGRSVAPGDVKRFIEGFTSLTPKSRKKQELLAAAGAQTTLDF